MYLGLGAASDGGRGRANQMRGSFTSLETSPALPSGSWCTTALRTDTPVGAPPGGLYQVTNEMSDLIGELKEGWREKENERERERDEKRERTGLLNTCAGHPDLCLIGLDVDF